jgi:hypothetical protein
MQDYGFGVPRKTLPRTTLNSGSRSRARCDFVRKVCAAIKEERVVGEYVELPGVRTWHEVEGQGESVVLLHGGFCANETWGPRQAELAADHRTFLTERHALRTSQPVENHCNYTYRSV